MDFNEIELCKHKRFFITTDDSGVVVTRESPTILYLFTFFSYVQLSSTST